MGHLVTCASHRKTAPSRGIGSNAEEQIQRTMDAILVRTSWRSISSGSYAQHDGTVVNGVVGAVEQGHRAAPAGVEDGLGSAGIRSQLLAVSPLKLRPSLDPMIEP